MSISSTPESPSAAVEIDIAGLCCPVCRCELVPESAVLRCTACDRVYPEVGGIPCLIDPGVSVFGHNPPPAPTPSLATRLLPALSGNPVSVGNYRRFLQQALAESDRPRILILGGAAVGKGLGSFLDDSRVDWVETDVFPSARTLLLCDAHQVPFEDSTFDAVVAQALLEHTLDPQLVISEIHRVLQPCGMVYAETPFMQQVHAGAHDFTRYTHLGHRRLFRFFEEIDSGPACGPGMAFAWSWQAFLTSFARGHTGRRFATLIARLTAFWLKYLDPFLVRQAAAYDGASSFYFWGRRTTEPLDDRELIASYRGIQ